ncbi:MAG TPA: MarR family transcriptional regulator [Jatrophihabitans sp.]|nr:MarR family transcriptional regulator [Jatrophihabitans sp.]
MHVEGAPDRLRRLPSWLIGQLNAAARRTVGQVLGAHDLHRSQYALLAALEQFGPQSQAQLSERSGLDRSDVVGWVDELSGRRLLRRDPDPEDRRRNVISINTAGKRLLNRLDLELVQAQHQLLAALSVPEQRQLIGLLTKALGAEAADGALDGAAPVIPDRRWH